MRTPQRRLDPGLIDDTLATPERYEFFQLVRLYDLIFRRQGRSRGAETVGNRIRFRNSLNLGFAPSQVEAMTPAYRQDEEGLETGELDKVEVTPSFIGLLGIHGALPTHYTEQVIKQQRSQRDHAGRAFLDLFTNRAVGHFYRAWKNHQLPLFYESDRDNRFLPIILSLGGFGFNALRDRLQGDEGSVNDESLAFFTGLLRQRPVSAEALRRALAGYFREKIEVEQFVGSWYVVPEGQRFALGVGSNLLGKDSLVGERVWQRNLRLRIHVGPLTHHRYLAFLPGGELAAALQKLLTVATGGQFEYEIRPILRAQDVRPASVGATGCRLGYDAFLVSRAPQQDRGDTRYFTQPLN